jgi:hypothetical protein
MPFTRLSKRALEKNLGSECRSDSALARISGQSPYSSLIEHDLIGIQCATGVFLIQQMPDVFISYPHKARSDALFFASTLQAKGLSAWVAETDLPAGREWKEKIGEALSNSSAIVFFVNPRWEPSPWMRQEYMQALESYWSGKTRILVPLLIGAKAEPPSFLKQWQSLRVESKSDWDDAASQLAQWIRNNQDLRSEPGKKEKRELSQRLDDIAKQAKQLQSNSILVVNLSTAQQVLKKGMAVAIREPDQVRRHKHLIGGLEPPKNIVDDLTKLNLPAGEGMEIRAVGTVGDKTVVRSSRTGEFRQVGTKKSRSSKAAKK